MKQWLDRQHWLEILGSIFAIAVLFVGVGIPVITLFFVSAKSPEEKAAEAKKTLACLHRCVEEIEIPRLRKCLGRAFSDFGPKPYHPDLFKDVTRSLEYCTDALREDLCQDACQKKVGMIHRIENFGSSDGTAQADATNNGINYYGSPVSSPARNC